MVALNFAFWFFSKILDFLSNFYLRQKFDKNRNIFYLSVIPFLQV